MFKIMNPRISQKAEQLLACSSTIYWTVNKDLLQVSILVTGTGITHTPVAELMFFN
jgi:hypothetical protein